MHRVRRYVGHVTVAASRLLNAIVNGHPLQTFSARAAEASHRDKRWGIAVSGILNFIHPGHTRRALRRWRREQRVIRQG